MASIPQRALRPDAQAFDEVRIVTVPRYKTSSLSGDEWRISAKIQFLRKGQVAYETTCRNIETACGMLMSQYYEAIDTGTARFSGEGEFCDQEGCPDVSDVTYKVLREFSRDRPHEWNKPAESYALGGEGIMIRKFCCKHSKRGDAGFDDADNNYELISGTPANPNPEDVKPSGFGGAIVLKEKQ